MSFVFFSPGFHSSAQPKHSDVTQIIIQYSMLQRFETFVFLNSLKIALLIQKLHIFSWIGGWICIKKGLLIMKLCHLVFIYHTKNIKLLKLSFKAVLHWFSQFYAQIQAALRLNSYQTMKIPSANRFVHKKILKNPLKMPNCEHYCKNL